MRISLLLSISFLQQLPSPSDSEIAVTGSSSDLNFGNAKSPLCELFKSKGVLMDTTGTCTLASCGDYDWDYDPTSRERVVLSYGHNGYGNQIFQHSFAYLVARMMNARFYIDKIDLRHTSGGIYPPNTLMGAAVMDKTIPDELKYYQLSTTSEDRALCDKEDLFIGQRPKDLRRWRENAYNKNMTQYFIDTISDPSRRCIKLIGYFQDYPFCFKSLKTLWSKHFLRVGNDSVRAMFDSRDISIYLRCETSHLDYHFSSVSYYQNILNHTSYNKLWLFLAPRCTHPNLEIKVRQQLNQVIAYLTKDLHGTYWTLDSEFGIDPSLDEFAGLMYSPRLIIPPGSTWAFWAGVLSNASEIHVEADYHRLMGEDMSKYVYHSEKRRAYFGRQTAHLTLEYKYIL